MIGADLIDLAGGFCEAALLQHAVAWDLFERTRRPASTGDLAEALGFEPRKLGPVLDALAALGLLVKQDGMYSSSTLALDHLVAGAPDDLRSFVAHLAVQAARWRDLDATLKARAPVHGQQEEELWRDSLAHERFLRAMAEESRGSAGLLAQHSMWGRCTRFIDAGGGRGDTCVAVARRWPALSGEVWDVPASAEIARALIAEFKMEDRVKFVGCNLQRSNPWRGARADLVLLANVAGNFGPRALARLFRRAAAVVPEGGTIAVFGPWLDESRSRPLSSAIFAVHMMVGCASGWVPPASLIRRDLEAVGLLVTEERVSEDEALWIGRKR